MCPCTLKRSSREQVLPSFPPDTPANATESTAEGWAIQILLPVLNFFHSIHILCPSCLEVHTAPIPYIKWHIFFYKHASIRTSTHGYLRYSTRVDDISCIDDIVCVSMKCDASFHICAPRTGTTYSNEKVIYSIARACFPRSVNM